MSMEDREKLDRLRRLLEAWNESDIGRITRMYDSSLKQLTEFSVPWGMRNRLYRVPIIKDLEGISDVSDNLILELDHIELQLHEVSRTMWIAHDHQHNIRVIARCPFSQSDSHES